MLWSPGTKILTCVVALAKRLALGWCPAPPRSEPKDPVVVGRSALGPDSTPGARRHALVPWTSAGRPAHRPASEEMDVQVEHALPGVAAHVGHQPPPGSIDALGLG